MGYVHYVFCSIQYYCNKWIFFKENFFNYNRKTKTYATLTRKTSYTGEKMLFNSFKFYCFFVIVFFIYYGMPHKWQKYILLIANFYFYISWNPVMSILLLGITILSFLAACLMERKETWKRLVLSADIFLSVVILVIFKYFNFFNEIINHFIERWRLPLHELKMFHIILPIGISFYLFQTISYVVDVYRGKYKAERNFLYYTLYVSFFLTISSGPIERAEHLLPQLKTEKEPIYENLTYGLKRISIGLFKKVAIADMLAFYIDAAYENIHSYTGIPLIVITLLYTVQIYCDFSGYSDIAIGCSRMLGLRLKENFCLPYFSSSIKVFWRRWHVSLSSWLTDYIYIPMGGNRGTYVRYLGNLMITFLISGLWHGANYTYILWGGYHAILMIVQALYTKYRKNKIGQQTLNKWNHGFLITIKVLCTFIAVDIGWIFFRANSIKDAIWIIKNLLNFSGQVFWGVFDGMIISNIVMLIVPLVLLIVIDMGNYLQGDIIDWISKKKICIRWVVYAIFVFIIFIYLPVTSVQKQFIYFQF